MRNEGTPRLSDLLRELNGSDAATACNTRDAYELRLQHYFNLWKISHKFHVGMLVESKPGFTRIRPLLDEYPAVITRLFPDTLLRHGESSSSDATFVDCNLLVVADDTAIEVACHTSLLQPYSRSLPQPASAVTERESAAKTTVWNQSPPPEPGNSDRPLAA